MSPKAEKVLEEALQLPDEARASIAGRLIESLEREIDEDAEAAWDKEIARRVRDLDSGSVKAVPWAEAGRLILESGSAPARG